MRLNKSYGGNWKVTIYRLLLFLFVFISVLNASVLPIGPIYHAFNIICVIGCIYLLTKRRKKLRSLRRISVAVLFVFFISAISSHNISMLVYAVFIIAAENDFGKLVKTVFQGTLLGLSCVIFLSLIKVVPDYTYEHLGGIAHSYGFYYYSTFPYYLFFASLMYIYIRKDRLKIIEILVLFAIQLFTYKAFTVRLTFYISVGVLVLTIVLIKFDFIDLNKKFVRWISAFFFPIACIFSVYIGTNYSASNSSWVALNSLMANRASQASYAFNNFSITFFGQQIEMQGRAVIAMGLHSGNYFFIDSGYVYSLLVYGILFTVVLLMLYSVLIVKVCETNNKPLYVWLIAVLVFSFMNDVLINVNMNPVLLCLPYLFKQTDSRRLKNSRQSAITMTQGENTRESINI